MKTTFWGKIKQFFGLTPNFSDYCFDDDNRKSKLQKVLRVIIVILMIAIVILILRKASCHQQDNKNDDTPTETLEVESETENEVSETETFERESETETSKREPETETSERESKTENSEIKTSESEISDSLKKPQRPATQTQKPIKVTAKLENLTSVFGDEINLTPKITIISGISGKTDTNEFIKTISLAKETGNGVRRYKLTPTCSAPNKYDVTWEGEAYYEITQRPTFVQIHDKTSYVGEKQKDLTCAFSNLAPGDNIPDVIALTANVNTNQIGEYPIIGKLKNTNYKILNDKGIIQSGTYKVIAKSGNNNDGNGGNGSEEQKPGKPETIDIEIKAIEVTYGSEEKPLSFTITQGNEVARDYIDLSRDKGDAIGRYRIHAKSKDEKKYVINVVNTDNAYYEITKRLLKIEVLDVEIREGEPIPENFSYNVVEGSIVKGDNVVSLTTSATSSDIGNFDIEVECKNSNYDLNVEKNGKIRIKPNPHQPEDKDEEIGGDNSSTSPSESGEGPKDEGESVKPSKPTPEESSTSEETSEEIPSSEDSDSKVPSDMPSDTDEEGLSPDKPTPGKIEEPEESEGLSSEEVQPTISTP